MGEEAEEGGSIPQSGMHGRVCVGMFSMFETTNKPKRKWAGPHTSEDSRENGKRIRVWKLSEDAMGFLTGVIVCD